MSDENVEVTFGAQVAGLLAGLGEATAGVKESVEGMKAQLNSLRETAQSLMEPFIAIGGLLAGGEMFKAAIEQTTGLAVSLETMSQKTGMTVEDLSRLQYAAELSHVSADELGVSIERLARGLESAAKGQGPAADALKTLGIAATNSNGQLRPLQDVLLQVAQRFAGMPDGTTKTALAMDLFGRSGAALIPLLNQGKEGIAQLESEADRLGATLTATDEDAILKYEDAMKRLHAATDAAKRSIVVGMMPALESIASGLTDAAVGGTSFRETGEAIGHVIQVIASVGIGAVGVLEELTGVFVGLWDSIRGDVKAAMADGAAMSQVAKDTVAQIKAMWATVQEPPAKKGGDGADGLGGPVKSPSILDQFQAEWLEEEAGQRDHFGKLTDLELAFWQKKLALVQQGSADYIQIQKRIATLQDQQAQAAYQGQLATLVAQEAADKDNLAQIVVDRQAELAIIRAHYDDASKEVQAGIARVNEAQNALQNQTKKEWTSAFDAIPAAFKNATGQIGTQVTSMRDLFRSFFDDLAKMSAAWGVKTLRDHVATELAKKNATAESVLERVALESWAAIKTVALNAWAAITSIANYAATAIAAAWASISAIPVVGPFLAPVAAVAAGAGVLALTGMVHSAAGGYDIPAGLNPMTQLHAQEMVLPAKYADVIRGLAGDGAAGSGGTHFHFAAGAIVATDAKSFEDRIDRSAIAVGKAVVKAHRAGVRLPTTPGRGA